MLRAIHKGRYLSTGAGNIRGSFIGQLGGGGQRIAAHKPGHGIVLCNQGGNLLAHINGLVVGLDRNGGLVNGEYQRLIEIIAIS